MCLFSFDRPRVVMGDASCYNGIPLKTKMKEYLNEAEKQQNGQMTRVMNISLVDVYTTDSSV